MSRDNFASPRVPALSEEKNTSRPACVCLTELFLLKLQMLSFISMLPFTGFSPPTLAFIFHVMAVPTVSHLRL